MARDSFIFYREYKEARFDINNGIALCQNCHKEVHQK